MMVKDEGVAQSTSFYTIELFPFVDLFSSLPDHLLNDHK